MKSVVNFRALAEGIANQDGFKIIPNTIFRSGNTDKMSPEDQDFLKNKVGVHVIYDFRTEHEVENHNLSEVFNVKMYDILQSADPKKMMSMNLQKVDEMVEMMDRLYYVDFGTTKNFKPVLEDIEKRLGEPFLFHCTAGRDRTGIMGAILMMIFDFSEEEIVEEYSKWDEQSLMGILSRMADGRNVEITEEIKDNFRKFIMPAKNQINGFLKRIKEDHGTFNQYLMNVYGIDQIKKAQYKEKYLQKKEN